jgi:hypothetical protein
MKLQYHICHKIKTKRTYRNSRRMRQSAVVVELKYMTHSLLNFNLWLTHNGKKYCFTTTYLFDLCFYFFSPFLSFQCGQNIIFHVPLWEKKLFIMFLHYKKTLQRPPMEKKWILVPLDPKVDWFDGTDVHQKLSEFIKIH